MPIDTVDMPTIKSVEEIKHAIERMKLVRDGCAQGNMIAHARIAQQSIDTLGWVLGEDNLFGKTVASVDGAINSAVAHLN